MAACVKINGTFVLRLAADNAVLLGELKRLVAAHCAILLAPGSLSFWFLLYPLIFCGRAMTAHHILLEDMPPAASSSGEEAELVEVEDDTFDVNKT